MGYVKLNLAISLDGYISRNDDSVDFLGEMVEVPDHPFNEFLGWVETIIMGSKSYEVMLGFGEYPFKDKNTVVMTRRTFDPVENIEFTDQSVIDIVAATNKNIWLFGGGELIRSFITNNLIDEYIITIVPVLIGSGKPLFKEFIGDVKLQLLKTETFNEQVTLYYKRVK